MRLAPARDLDRERLERVRAIYEAGFPADLRSSFDGLLDDRALVLLDDDAAATPLGLAVLRDLGDTGWAFLRYLVVDGSQRGRGLGGRFWGLLREAHPHHSRIVLDVEDPAEPGVDDAERTIRTRRIGFYERLGVALLPVLAYEPPHDGRPEAMRLMLADLDRPAGASTPVPAPDDLRDVVRTVFAQRYGLAADDPAVVGCLRASGLAG